MLAWRDVVIGAVTTVILFTIGKTQTAVKTGNSDVAAGFGAASAIIIVLGWLYYSALIFLAGAEFTRAWANLNGSKQAVPVPAKPADAVLAKGTEQDELQLQSAPALKHTSNAVLQLLATLLPFVATGAVQGLVQHWSWAAHRRQPHTRRG